MQRGYTLGKPVYGTSKPQGMSDMEWAMQQINAAMEQQQLAATQARNASFADLNKQRDSRVAQAQAFANALRGLNVPGKLTQTYGDAAGEIQGLVGGLAAGQASGAQASAAQDRTALSGSGQEGSVRDMGATMGQVLSGTYGDIPARQLGETGRAYAEEAAKQPDLAVQMGQYDAQTEYAAAVKDLQSSSGSSGAFDPKDAIDLARARMAMRMDILQMRAYIQDRKWKAQDRKTKAQDKKLERLMDQADLAMKQGRFDQAQKYLELAYAREGRIAQSTAFSQQMQVTRENRAANSSMGLDAAGNPKPGYKIKGGRVVKVPTSSSSSAKGPKWGDIQADIADDVPDLTIDVPDPKDWRSKAGLSGAATVKQKMPYDQAFNVLWSKYSGMVQDKARLKALIRRILARNGIKQKKPGADVYGGLH